MRRFATTILCLAMLLSLCACGNVSKAETKTVESELYSQEDIEAAIKVIKRDFRLNWRGCTLTSIYYAGDERTSSEIEYYGDKYSDRQLIVLLSSFDVAKRGADPSLSPGSSNDNWCWILVRKEGGMWHCINKGYG